MSDCAIGICAAVERVKRGPWDEVVTMVQRTYPTAIQRVGGYFHVSLNELARRHPVVKEVRGFGLMLGMELAALIVEEAHSDDGSGYCRG